MLCLRRNSYIRNRIMNKNSMKPNFLNKTSSHYAISQAGKDGKATSGQRVYIYRTLLYPLSCVYSQILIRITLSFYISYTPPALERHTSDLHIGVINIAHW